mgnify:FL=1
MKESKIIQIADLIEEKVRKESELAFYEEEMQKLQFRMGLIRHEIGLTETIIRIIQNKEIPDILKNIEKYVK